MFSLKKWILRNPNWTRILYLITILVFFTETSFDKGVFYFQAIVILSTYGLWCRPFLMLVGDELKKKNSNANPSPLSPNNREKNRENSSFMRSGRHWEKTLLVNGVWLFCLIPIKLAVVDPLDLWNFDVFAWKILFFSVVVFVVFYNCTRSLESIHYPMAGNMARSFVKGFFILFLIPVWAILFFPFLLTLFYF